MTFDENASIRYLMKEMDPSEEVIFEQKMMNDENLLIEVECLRKVNRQLNDLPEISAPTEIRDRILHKAARLAEAKAHRTQTRTVYYSTAAVVLIGLVAGSFLILQPQDGEESGAENGDTRQALTAGTPSLINETNRAFSSSSGSELTPWVDNDEVIHFSGRFEESHSSAYDSIFRNSYQKLQPLRKFDNSVNPVRDLHLTGTGND